MKTPQIPHEEIRLYQVQEVLAEQLDLPLRLLRLDAFKRVVNVLSEKQRLALELCCDTPVPEEPLTEEIPEALTRALVPESDSAEVTLSRALWLTPVSAQNPLFGDLQNRFSTIRALSRLNYLRLIRACSEGTIAPVLNWTSSFIERLERIELPRYAGSSGAILVVGPLWSRTRTPRGDGGTQHSFGELEWQVRDLLSRLGQQANRLPLINQQLEGLLALGSAFVNFDRDFLDSKIRLATHGLKESVTLLTQQPELVKQLSSVEWGRAVQWVAFWRSRRFSPLLEDHVLRPLWQQLAPASEEAHVSFSLRTSLVGTWKEARHSIRLEVTAPSTVTQQGVSTRFHLEAGPSPGDPGRITFIADTSSIKLSEDHLKQIQFSYLRFLEERRTARGRQDYLAFDRLRGALQDLPFDDTEARERIIVRRARRLVMADYAALFRYDSLHDRLRLEHHRAPPWGAELNRSRLGQHLEVAARDPAERAQSVVYRCLDQQQIQSSFDPASAHGEPEPEPRLAGKQVLWDRAIWGFDAADFLAAPIVFHGRTIGVLYLATAEPFRFRYADHNRLVTFVRSFEAELFEARLFRSLQRINKELGKALRANVIQQEQQSFVVETIREVGDLLAVRGATLWWRSPLHPEALRLLAKTGEGLPVGLNVDLELTAAGPPFVELLGGTTLLPKERSDSEGYSELFSDLLQYLVIVPLWDQNRQRLNGVISLHDARPIGLPPSFRDELLFLGQEVEQNLAQYMAARDRVEAIRDLIAHDVGTALRSIQSVKGRVAATLAGVALSDRERQSTSRMLSDIEVHVDTARHLLDWLTQESVQTEVTFKRENPLIAYYHYLNSLALRRPTSVRNIINGAYQPRLRELRARHISVQQHASIVPALWVRDTALRQVFTNLFDNIVKYGAQRHQVVVDDGADELEFFVNVDTLGVPLRPELRTYPEMILERATRGAEQAVAIRTPGSGDGLYIAKMLARSWGGAIILKYEHDNISAKYSFRITFPRWLAQPSNPWTP